MIKDKDLDILNNTDPSQQRGFLFSTNMTKHFNLVLYPEKKNKILRDFVLFFYDIFIIKN